MTADRGSGRRIVEFRASPLKVSDFARPSSGSSTIRENEERSDAVVEPSSPTLSSSKTPPTVPDRRRHRACVEWYLLRVACPCGWCSERWVTPGDAQLDRKSYRPGRTDRRPSQEAPNLRQVSSYHRLLFHLPPACSRARFSSRPSETTKIASISVFISSSYPTALAAVTLRLPKFGRGV